MAGYNWRAGKSNNAVAAETQGLVVKSKITADWLKAHGIKEKVGFKFGETCSRSLKFAARVIRLLCGTNLFAVLTGTTCLAAQSHSTSEPRAKYKRTDPIAGKTNRETLPRFG